MPDGNFSSAPKKQNKIMEYIERNKFLTGLVCISLVLIIIIAVISAVTAHNKASIPVNIDNQASIDTSKSQNIEVLPQVQRVEDTKQSSDSGDGQKRDPFAGPIVLKGTIIGDNGYNQALISANGISYVVRVNEKIGNNWIVKKIDREEVILQSNVKELTLRLSEHETSAASTQSNSN